MGADFRRAGARRDKGGDDPLGSAVARAQCGEEAAFSYVYEKLQPVLLGYLRGLVDDDAEDVASEAWLVIARDLGQFRGDGSGFRGWAVTVARRRALDLLRRKRRQPQGLPLDEGAQQLPVQRAAEEDALEKQSTRRAVKLIATLPPDQAEAVLLRVVAGLDARAAGEVLGKRAGAVRSASHRGLRRLAESLAAWGELSWQAGPAELAGPGDPPGLAGPGGTAWSPPG